MAIIQNNVTFARVNNIGNGTPIPNIKKGSVSNMTDDINDNISSEEFANTYGAVQSLNIDWNGAELGSTYDGISRINTTGDLIMVLQG